MYKMGYDFFTVQGFDGDSTGKVLVDYRARVFPKVSIIIPVYNVEKYLRQCLDSVVNQTLKDIEIICIDDCSPDNSLDILWDYANRDDRIKIIKLSKNSGLGNARNVGLKYVLSEYVMFLDSDDWFELSLCEKAYNKIYKNKNDFVFFNFYVFEEKKGITKVDDRKFSVLEKSEDVEHIDFSKLSEPFKCGSECWFKIYNVDFLRKNSIKFLAGCNFEDQPFYAKAFISSKNVSFINETLMTYRKREGTITTNSKYWVDVVFARKLVSMLIKKELPLVLKQSLLANQINSLLHWFKVYTKIDKKIGASFYEEIRELFLSYEFPIVQSIKYSIDFKKYKMFLRFKSYNFYKFWERVIKNFSVKQISPKCVRVCIFGIKFTVGKKKNRRLDDLCMHVFFASDDGFAKHLGVVLTSILRTSYKEDKFCFYILDDDISEENKTHILNLRRIKNFEIKFIKVDNALFEKCPQIDAIKHVTRQTYYRYIIPQIVPNLDKVLYLDCDIIVKKSLRKLWETNLNNAYCGAVEELSKYSFDDAKRLGVSAEFNAGILLLNNKKLKENDLTKVLFFNTEKLYKEGILLWQDQDVLNYTFKDNVVWLSPRYNWQQNAGKKPYFTKYTRKDIRNAKKEKVIIHYNNSHKPWKLNCEFHPMDYYMNLFFYGFRIEALNFMFRYGMKSFFVGMNDLKSKIFTIKKSGGHKVIIVCGVKFKFNVVDFVRIKKNRIVFMNLGGRHYACNPKYITKEIIKQKLPYELVWVVNKDVNKNDFPKEVKIVNYTPYNALKLLSSSKVWVKNNRATSFIDMGLKKSKKQLYIQTWHGGVGFKKIEKDIEHNVNYVDYLNTAKVDSKYIDYLMVPSEFDAHCFSKNFYYNGEILKFGYPRNDIFFYSEEQKISIKQKVKDFYNIPQDKKIVIYVPTFRDNKNLDMCKFDADKLCFVLNEKFGGEWVCLIRLHPNIMYKKEEFSRLFSSNVVNVSDYSDVQELLLVSDVFISDYTSSFWDFVLSEKPAFVFATDVENYVKERDFYIPLEKMPFSVARSETELFSNIRSFDFVNYKDRLDSFGKYRRSYDDGYASKRVVEIIKRFIDGNS